MSTLKTAIIVNLGAHNGRTEKQWVAIAPDVLRLLPPDTLIVSFRPPTDIEPKVRELLAEGVQVFISAGGDGSVNYLLNVLLLNRGDDNHELYLGGIGLGVNNDFVKSGLNYIQGLPTRLDFATASKADVGKVEFQSSLTGEWVTRYFISNAGLGVFAEINRMINDGDWVIRKSKKRWPRLTFLYAAVCTVFNFQSFPAAIILDDKKRVDTTLSNLAVLKCPFVSNDLHFDDPVKRNDGFFGVDICYGMRRFELLQTLIALTKGHFRYRSKTLCLTAKKLEVRADVPTALELDGEVFLTDRVVFTVIPEGVSLLGL